jgi:hypothetical protein
VKPYTAREAQAAQDRPDQIFAMEVAPPNGDTIAAPNDSVCGIVKQRLKYSWNCCDAQALGTVRTACTTRE